VSNAVHLLQGQQEQLVDPLALIDQLTASYKNYRFLLMKTGTILFVGMYIANNNEHSVNKNILLIRSWSN
jgi:hypothetical protein